MPAHANQLQKLQNRAALIITKVGDSVRSCDILKELFWPMLHDKGLEGQGKSQTISNRKPSSLENLKP